ncbi:hypothetical protein [Streptomyces hawaiiensis]|uniref:Uncharacterized protein n=1 Tax=Streptomyces hawaiiensis TaxID=67305 RepID=A0A6G5RNG9_9ACTN|nr:hypothetical protein [Streptomyces hawaiiensis]QCD59613.1 hypothetical protein CEB94_36030 [Streptomyces hawaiiensis]
MDETRHRPVRRAELAGGAGTALLAVAAFAGHATTAGLPWWAVLAVAVSTAGLVGWTGAHLGRGRRPRDDSTDHGEQIPGAYPLRAPHPERLPPQGPRG